MYEAFNAGPEHSRDGHVQEQVEAYRALPEWSYVLGNIPDCGFQERIRVEEFEVPREIITTVSHGNSVTRACSLPDRLFGSRTRFLYQWTSSNGWEIVIHAGVQFDWDRLYEINVPGRGLFGRIRRRFSKGYVDNYGL